MIKITPFSSLAKPVLTGLSVVFMLLILILSISTWRKVAILESELINREVIPSYYADNKPLLPMKKEKSSNKKLQTASRHSGRKSVKSITRNVSFSNAESSRTRKYAGTGKKRRTLDEVLYDIADTMIVVEDR